MDLREINFGVEIETVKRMCERVARAIQSIVGEVVEDQWWTCKVVSDGSLVKVSGPS